MGAMYWSQRELARRNRAFHYQPHVIPGHESNGGTRSFQGGLNGVLSKPSEWTVHSLNLGRHTSAVSSTVALEIETAEVHLHRSTRTLIRATTAAKARELSRAPLATLGTARPTRTMQRTLQSSDLMASWIRTWHRNH